MSENHLSFISVVYSIFWAIMASFVFWNDVTPRNSSWKIMIPFWKGHHRKSSFFPKKNRVKETNLIWFFDCGKKWWKCEKVNLLEKSFWLSNHLSWFGVIWSWSLCVFSHLRGRHDLSNVFDHPISIFFKKITQLISLVFRFETHFWKKTCI